MEAGVIEMSKTAASAEVGIIGGSGMYDLSFEDNAREIDVSTPYGRPSDTIVFGELMGRAVAFIPRHGRGHRLEPTEIPAAANMYALKQAGVTEIVSVSAVGSLREELAPGHSVVPDQLVDLSRSGSRASFFGAGIVVHLPFADPFCSRTRPLLVEAACGHGGQVHDGGTYVCIAGPQFSTRAESELYRRWGMDVIGMTVAAEAKLAREAGICYASLALVTDYDCWRTDHEAVTAEAVAAVMRANVATAQAAVRSYLRKAPRREHCSCHDALAHAILSCRSSLPLAVRDRVDLVAGRFLDPPVRY
jgi:5'-methylthioadenosine phosphorylase